MNAVQQARLLQLQAFALPHAQDLPQAHVPNRGVQRPIAMTPLQWARHEWHTAMYDFEQLTMFRDPLELHSAALLSVKSLLALSDSFRKKKPGRGS
jgi:hypothetical protein